MRLASATVAGMMSKISGTLTAGEGATPAAPAKMAHAQRPATMPKGTPMSSAAAARTVAFHATTAWTWRLVSPRVFSAARSTYAARYVAC